MTTERVEGEPMKVFAIKHDNGTYYREMTGIGPRFGATEQDAHRFDTQEDALRASRGWQFLFTQVVQVKRESEEGQ